MGRKRKYPKHKQKKPKWYQKESEWGDFIFDWGLGLEKDTWREIFGIIIFLFSVIIILGFFDLAGIFGTGMTKIMHLTFGTVSSYIFAFGFLLLGISLLAQKYSKIKLSILFGYILLILSMSGFFHLFIP